MEDHTQLRDFLNKISIFAMYDLEARAAVKRQNAPQFNPLAFFHSGETIETEIIAHLIDPGGVHGQRERFLRIFLDALNLGLNVLDINSVVIETNSPCFALKPLRSRSSVIVPGAPDISVDRFCYRMIDILVQYRAGGKEYVVAIESKSRGAGDQQNQIADYLEHLCKAYPTRIKYLIYLKDGAAPSSGSIDRIVWETATAGHKVCHAVNFPEFMAAWLFACMSECTAPRVASFLHDFAILLGLERVKMDDRNGKLNAHVGNMIYSVAKSGESSNEFEALLGIYEMQEEIWRFSIANCMDRVTALLKEQLPDLVLRFARQPIEERFYLECKIHLPITGHYEPRLWIGVDTEDWTNDRTRLNPGPTYLNLYIRKSFELDPPQSLSFNDRSNLWIGPRKSEWVRTITLPGIDDLRSSNGLRALVVGSAASHIATEVVRLSEQYRAAVETCFPHASEAGKPL